MNSQRLRLVLLISIGASAILFLIILVVGLSALSTKSKKMVELNTQSKSLNDQLASLTKAKKQVQKYSYIKDLAQQIIPNDKDQAQAVLEIFKIAGEAGIDIQSVSFPSSTLGVASATSSTSASSVLSQAKPVSGIQGLYSVQLTIAPETGSQVPAGQQVTYPKMLDFLDRIERDQRTAQITQINVQTLPSSTGSSSSNISFSLTLNIFIRP